LRLLAPTFRIVMSTQIGLGSQLQPDRCIRARTSIAAAFPALKQEFMNSVCIGPDPVRWKEFLCLVGRIVQYRLLGYATAIFSFLSRVLSKLLPALLDRSDHASEFLP